MPIKVPKQVIDNDLFMYGQCYIETDHMGNERRIDPLQLRLVRNRPVLMPPLLKLDPDKVEEFKREWEKYFNQHPSVTWSLEQVENEQKDCIKMDMAERLDEPTAETFVDVNCIMYGLKKVETQPQCTCRDDDKYARPLCPVCDKERYDAAMKVDIAVTKEMFKDKPEDIITTAEFFKSIKGDI